MGPVLVQYNVTPMRICTSLYKLRFNVLSHGLTLNCYDLIQQKSLMFFLYCYINTLKPSGHYMYHQFNIQQFYVLPTQCIYVFCTDLRRKSDYVPIQH
jgi:hypothetical protein